MTTRLRVRHFGRGGILSYLELKFNQQTGYEKQLKKSFSNKTYTASKPLECKDAFAFRISDLIMVTTDVYH